MNTPAPDPDPRTAGEVVDEFLRLIMIPDPDAARRYTAPGLRIRFTGNRAMNDPAECTAFNRARDRWVKKRIERTETVVRAARGGDLGWVQRHELVAALADVAFSLQPGQMSHVVELPEGLHLLRCEEVIAAAAAEFEPHRERIVAHLGQRKAEAATAAYLERLRAQARIEVLVPLPPVAQRTDESYAPSRRAREMKPAP